MSGHLLLRWVAVASLAAAGVGLGALPRLGPRLLGDRVQIEVLNGGPGAASSITLSVDAASVTADSLGHASGAGPRVTVRAHAGVVQAKVRWSNDGRVEQWSQELHVAGAVRVELILRPGGTVQIVTRGRQG